MEMDTRSGEGHHAYMRSEERIRFMRNVVEDIKGYIDGSKVVDLGSGDGSITKLLSRYAKEVYAVDSSESMLAEMAENCSSIPNIVPLLSPQDRLMIDDESIDVVFSSSSFHDLPKGYESEIARVLRPNGHAVIFDWKKADSKSPPGPPQSIRLNKNAVVKRFGLAGLSKITEKDYAHQYLLIFEKTEYPHKL
jgi:ubiquinone/menaquinone biosynthesis C-methylase UbiE